MPSSYWFARPAKAKNWPISFASVRRRIVRSSLIQLWSALDRPTRGASIRPEANAGRDIDFGWVIAPRSRIGTNYEQIDGQYSLTAFISVPAWWRTAKASIKTCWLSRSTLAKD